MAIHLVTGRQGQAHITSTDVRALNRGLFNSTTWPIVTIKNANGDSPQVVVANGAIKVTEGHLVWRGLQINITATTTIIETIVANSTYYIYLEYTKTASGNDYVESADIVGSTTALTQQDLTSDSQTFARKQLAAVVINSAGTDGTVSEYYSQSSTMGELTYDNFFFNSHIRNSSIHLSESDREFLYDAPDEISSLTALAPKIPVLLYEGSITYNTAVSLSENPYNFKSLLFVPDVMISPSSSGMVYALSTKQAVVAHLPVGDTSFWVSFPTSLSTFSGRIAVSWAVTTTTIKISNVFCDVMAAGASWGSVNGQATTVSSLDRSNWQIYGFDRISL